MRGTVTRPVRVRIKKGKNWAYSHEVSVRYIGIPREWEIHLFVIRVFRTHLDGNASWAARQRSRNVGMWRKVEDREVSLIV